MSQARRRHPDRLLDLREPRRAADRLHREHERQEPDDERPEAAEERVHRLVERGELLERRQRHDRSAAQDEEHARESGDGVERVDGDGDARLAADEIEDVRDDGQREHRWDGLLRNAGRIADSATYVVRVEATSSLLTTGGPGGGRPRESQQQFFRVEQSYAPLEDTLPSLPANMLLPDKIPGSAPWKDLIKGIAVGGLAYAAPVLLLKSPVKWQLHAVIGAGAGIAAGVGSFLYRRHDPSIPENVSENARRQAQRKRFNDAVQRNNADKLAKRTLIITPLTGAGR